MSEEDFYCRYYVGHKGKFGHEFLEFEFRPDGENIFYYFYYIYDIQISKSLMLTQLCQVSRI